MSIHSNVTGQDWINLRELGEEQKEQRTLKIKNRILKQTDDVKLAESLSPVTKKVEEVSESAKKIGEVIKKSISENNQEIVPSGIDDIQTNLKSLPNSSNFSISIRQMLGSLMNGRSSLKITQDEIGQANISGIPIQISGGDRTKINDDIYDLTPEKNKFSSSTSYNGKSMKNESDFSLMNNFVNDLVYTGRGDKSLKRKNFFTIELPKRVEEIQKTNFNELGLEGQGVKTIIPSNKIDICSRLEVLLGIQLSGHTNTLTEASNAIDELYKRGEIQNKQHYRNALNKLSI